MHDSPCRSSRHERTLFLPRSDAPAWEVVLIVQAATAMHDAAALYQQTFVDAGLAPDFSAKLASAVVIRQIRFIRSNRFTLAVELEPPQSRSMQSPPLLRH